MTVRELVARFEGRVIAKSDWTHREHLAVGAWYVSEYGAAQALDRLRLGIRALNDAHGTPNSSSSGYHETITRAYVMLLEQFLSGCDAAWSIDERVTRLVIGPLADRGVLLRYYSSELLTSSRARLDWHEPDLAPIVIQK